jgi:hypothetical protein
LRFRSFTGKDVEVRGWAQLATKQEHADWMKQLRPEPALF